MWKLYVAFAVIWAALMPPFFTGGACNREFEKYRPICRRIHANIARRKGP